MSGGSGTGERATGGAIPAESAFEAMLTSDLDVFFNSAEFAKTAYHNGAGVLMMTPIKVIFSAPFGQISPATGEIETTSPQAQCKASDAASIVHGTKLVIDGVTYKVRGKHPGEDSRETVLILSKD